MPKTRLEVTDRTPEKAVSLDPKAVRRDRLKDNDRKKDKTNRITVAGGSAPSTPESDNVVKVDQVQYLQPPTIETTGPSPRESPRYVEEDSSLLPSVPTPENSQFSTPKTSQKTRVPDVSPGTAAAGEKVLRAKTAIVGILRDIHSILTELNQGVTASEDINTIIFCVKLVKYIKEELSKSSEVINVTSYNISLPPKTYNKLD